MTIDRQSPDREDLDDLRPCNSGSPDSPSQPISDANTPEGAENLDQVPLLLQLLYTRCSSNWDRVAKEIGMDRTTILRWRTRSIRPQHRAKVCELLKEGLEKLSTRIDTANITVHTDPQGDEPVPVQELTQLITQGHELRSLGLEMLANRLFKSAAKLGDDMHSKYPDEMAPKILACTAVAQLGLKDFVAAKATYSCAAAVARKVKQDRNAYRYDLSERGVESKAGWLDFRAGRIPEHEMHVVVHRNLEFIKNPPPVAAKDRVVARQRNGLILQHCCMMSDRIQFIRCVRLMVDLGAREGFDGLMEARDACKANADGEYDKGLDWLRSSFS